MGRTATRPGRRPRASRSFSSSLSPWQKCSGFSATAADARASQARIVCVQTLRTHPFGARHNRAMPADVAASLQDPGLLAPIAKGMDDAIFAKDLQGRYQFAIPAALCVIQLPL